MNASRQAWLAVVMVVLALAACGPSARQLADAREAIYQGDRAQLFDAVVAEVQRHHQVDEVDRAAGVVVTKPVQRGLRVQSRDPGIMQVVVSRMAVVLTDGPPYRVRVEPRAALIVNGGAPYRLTLDNPECPGWVRGQVEELQLALYRRLRVRFAGAPGTVAPQ